MNEELDDRNCDYDKRNISVVISIMVNQLSHGGDCKTFEVIASI